MDEMITAAELAKMFRISIPTLYRILKSGPARFRSHDRSVDLRMIPDFYIGGRRFWRKQAAETLLAEIGI